MSRRLISVLAVLGMLMHGLALARHGTVLLDAGLQHENVATELAPAASETVLAWDLHVLCRSANSSESGNGDGGKGPNPLKDCPICTGTASAFMLPAPDLSPVITPRRRIADCFALTDQRATVLRFIRPASRGPPANA